MGGRWLRVWAPCLASLGALGSGEVRVAPHASLDGSRRRLFSMWGPSFWQSGVRVGAPAPVGNNLTCAPGGSP